MRIFRAEAAEDDAALIAFAIAVGIFEADQFGGGADVGGGDSGRVWSGWSFGSIRRSAVLGFGGGRDGLATLGATPCGGEIRRDAGGDEEIGGEGGGLVGLTVAIDIF